VIEGRPDTLFQEKGGKNLHFHELIFRKNIIRWLKTDIVTHPFTLPTTKKDHLSRQPDDAENERHIRIVSTFAR
jgi:hypothetical protein